MSPEPRATYRLQLCPEFGFEKTSAWLDYFAELGISHLYLSPYLQATRNSQHGYDIVDHSKINKQIGNEETLEQLYLKLKERGIKLMIDIVPNHMAIDGKDNLWWWDVLENGPSSRFASFFDIDWAVSGVRSPNKILLPILGDHYGRILENRELKLVDEEGVITLQYHDQNFPLDPLSLAHFFRKVALVCNSELLTFLAESLARLPKSTETFRQAVDRRHRDKIMLFNLLKQLYQKEKNIQEAIHKEISSLNNNIEELHDLLEEQNYRLAFWKVANSDLGYRRFFDINDLIGLRIEEVEVFERTHALPIEWFSKGFAHAFRVDHPDGLQDPKKYFERLNTACPKAWIIAEKILGPHEKLPSSWNVSGTTGYDFLNLLAWLYTDPRGSEALTIVYQEMIEEELDFNSLAYECKLLVLKELFVSEVHWLTSLFVEISEKHRRHRDYTRLELQETLCQVAACFPVYRTYISSAIISEEDSNTILKAISLAMKKKPDLHPELFHFLKSILLLQIKGFLEEELSMRFQQLTSSVMAKGFEDTALYRYNKLVALNEVGGDPTSFGISLFEFHEVCKTALKERPFSLISSTTHDTKHSEDVRSRLELLSEIPEEYKEALKRWMEMNSCTLKNGKRDQNTEILFYQILMGAWPIELTRLLSYMEKAIREAKEHTSWNKPNEEYEQSIRQFVISTIESPHFRQDFESFISPLIYPGRINSLAQTLIKCTSPGIPDFYQGSELWNLTLVDPDNRGLVDFSLRHHLLKEMEILSPEEILKRMDEGLPKLFVIQKTLALRKKYPEPFSSQGSYTPLYAQGEKAHHVVAYLRNDSILTIVPRFLLRLKNDWRDTAIEIPEGHWVNVFTQEEIVGKNILLKTLLTHFPVVLLAKKI